MNSLAIRLYLITVGVLVIAGFIVLLASNIYGRSAANNAFDRLLTGAVLQISESVYVRGGALAVDLPLSAFQLLALAKDDRIFYHVIGLNGETITGYDKLSSAEPSDIVSIKNDSFLGFDVRKASITVPVIEQEVTGNYVVVVAQTMNARNELARDMTFRSMTLLGILGVAVLALVAIAIRWAIGPLHQLERELQSREPLDFSPISTKVPHEMKTFVDSMNRFMQRLSRRINTMQRLVADSVHQIRTPIAALHAQAEMHIDESNISALKTNKERILAQTQELSHLSEQLLTQALISHRADTVLTEKIDLRKIAVDAERTVRAMALWPEEAILLELCEDEVSILGDQFSLREAVKNLIVNALNYGKYPVTIRVTKDAVISVLDQGDGFMPEHIEMRFKNSANNTGLGLAIVHDVVAQHNAELKFANPQSGGFCVQITFGLCS